MRAAYKYDTLSIHYKNQQGTLQFTECLADSL